MSFVVDTADFPEIGEEKTAIIFDRLEKGNWIKLHDHNRMEHTIWFYSVAPEPPEEAIKTARHNFTACCIPYCIPRLAVEWGTSDNITTQQFAITH